MLVLICGFLLGSSSERGLSLSSNSQGPQTVHHEINCEESIAAFPGGLSEVVTVKKNYDAIQLAASLMPGLDANDHDINIKSLLVVNLLKRIMNFYPKSVDYINRERKKFDPNSQYADNTVGPTPEILLVSVFKYVPSNRRDWYVQFVLYFFPDLAQEGVKKAKAQAYQDKVCDRVNRWMGEKILPAKTYVKGAYHPRPWR